MSHKRHYVSMVILAKGALNFLSSMDNNKHSLGGNMYSVYINDVFSGHANDAAAAMRIVSEQAIPFNNSWEIRDPFGNTYARS